MAMADPRNNAKTIPSAFIELNDTTDSADECINVRDEQVFWENHNILCAQGIRRTVATIYPHLDGALLASAPWYSMSIPTAGAPEGFDCIFSEVFFFSRFVEAITVKVRARHIKQDSENSADPKLLATVNLPQELPTMENAASMTIATNSDAAYSATVNIPDRPRHEQKPGPRELRLSLILSCGLEDTAASTTFTEATENFVGVGSSFTTSQRPPESFAVLDTVSPGSEPMQLGGKIQVVGSNTRYHLAKVAPTPIDTSGTEYRIDVIGIGINSISIYEDAVSDFESRYTPVQ